MPLVTCFYYFDTSISANYSNLFHTYGLFVAISICLLIITLFLYKIYNVNTKMEELTRVAQPVGPMVWKGMVSIQDGLQIMISTKFHHSNCLVHLQVYSWEAMGVKSVSLNLVKVYSNSLLYFTTVCYLALEAFLLNI